jgi:phosphoribosylanthranilate isomerase
VFRDAPLEAIIDARDSLELDWVQLHGGEPDRYLDRLGAKVIRRLRPTAGVDWRVVESLGERCLPLIDPGAGSGIAWSWQSLVPPPPGIRFGLAGGLRPDTVAEAVRALRPHLVDVSSGVEASPGVKDPERVVDFIGNARSRDTV